MAEELHLTPGISKQERYRELLPQIKSVVEAESDLIANLANVSAMLKEAFSFLWVGFYRVEGNELILGPFQGPLACTRIQMGKGVCGKAASTKETIIVPDVHAFPGHIACSSESKSEIVVPLVVDSLTKLVLDVDSDRFDEFSSIDHTELTHIIEIIGRQHYS